MRTGVVFGALALAAPVVGVAASSGSPAGAAAKPPASTVVRVTLGPGPMCTYRHDGMRMRVFVRPSSITTVVGEDSPYLHATRINNVGNKTWIIHNRTAKGVPHVPEHTFHVFVMTPDGQKTFTLTARPGDC